MTPEQQAELQQIRQEQRALAAGLEQLEIRLGALEGAEIPAAAAVPLFTRPVATPPPALPPEPSLPAVAPVAAATSLEMQIGTVWLVRTGIVLLLTSLAFAGNYLYVTVVPHLGAGGKIGLLYLAAGAVTVFGAWLERSPQARELIGLQNYARVVFAGGLAAIYYVTYAAHYYPRLRIVESDFFAGFLLLAWAAFMVWLADRRESEILATFAILLAYYTSAINGIASFTLFSNLVLSGGAVYLIRRHLWRVFPFASLLATFGSYAFWRYFHFYTTWRGFDTPDTIHLPVAGFWVESGFLAVYWALFTWAILTVSGERVPTASRQETFVGLNNGAFFLLTTWLLLAEYPGTFWRWSLGFGCALLVLGEAGRRRRPPIEAAVEKAYQTQGVLLVTLGLISYFSGWQLSLILAVQSRALLVAAERRGSTRFLALAGLSAFLAFLAAQGGLQMEPKAGSSLAALVVGAFFLEEGWRCERRLVETAADPAKHSATVSKGPLWEATTACFALLGASIWFSLLAVRVTFLPAYAPVLALAALGLLLLGVLLRFPAVLFFATGYLLAAQGSWLLHYGTAIMAGSLQPPWWNIVIVLAATLAFCEAAKRPDSVRRNSNEAEQGLRLLLIACQTLGTLCGWCYVSYHLTLLPGSAFNLAARWSLYAAAVFGVGLALHERVYRWLGLFILVATLGRVVFIDVWQLDSMERALSFLTLGLVLLALGFFYTRFGAKIRDMF